MADAVDILFNDDVIISGGDLDVGISDQQHIEHIFRAHPGQFYQHPTLGIGIEDDNHGIIHKPSRKQTIRKQLEFDNYRINKIEITGEVDELLISVDAIRKT